jgi:hypothetical protein
LESTEANGSAYDDAALERMMSRFQSYDDLLKYVKRYGMHRHFEHAR